MFYTVICDPPGSTCYRQVGVLMLRSLLKSGAKDIRVFKNTPDAILPEAPEIVEHYIDVAPTDFHEVCRWKYLAADYIDGDRHEFVCYLDSDMLVLDSLRAWFGGQWDILYANEAVMKMRTVWHFAYLTDEQFELSAKRLGVNGGFFAVKGSLYNATMQELARIDASPPNRSKLKGAGEQPAWNRLICDLGDRATSLPHGSIVYPFMNQPFPWEKRWDTRLVHFAGRPPLKKLPLMKELQDKCFQPNTTSSLKGRSCD